MAPSRATGNAPKAHTYDSGCRLAPLKNPFTAAELEDIPPVKAQFFYTSVVPIDDPLSTSTIAASTDANAAKGITQPFSEGDNNELEKAWLSLSTDEFRRNHAFARRDRSPSPSLAKTNSKRLEVIIHELARKHVEIHATERAPQEFMEAGFDTQVDQDDSEGRCCAELVVDVGIALRTSFCALARRRQPELDRDRVAQRVMSEIKKLGESLLDPDQRRDSRRSSSRPSSRRESRSLPQPFPVAQVAPIDTSVPPSSLARTSAADDGLTGMPFVRVGTPESTNFSPASSLPKATGAIFSDKQNDEQARRGRMRSNTAQKRKTSREASRKLRASSTIAEQKTHSPTASVPVGVSRLHEVSLPALQMKPIYWSPVNDISAVLRATWFYKEDMRPVDTAVANQLEAGYRELKPHAQTWQDELRSAIDVGPAGEEKVSHPLWPPTPKATSKQPAKIPEAAISHDPFCAARCFRGEAAAEGTRLENAHEDSAATTSTPRKFDQYHVIYKDETTAYLLKPSLKPSAYYGRRPVAKIMKGFSVGVAVVRGFDAEVWAKKHQKKPKQQTSTAPSVFSLSQSLRETRQEGCLACRAADERGQVTDLVLVAHGIGQKLAERVETYHFTHAINAFRRAINIELGNEEIKSVLRDGQNGIMVLPVNWRQNLSFEDGGPMTAEDKDEYAPESFGLKDIEPKTIPAVRSMISDVMFDIPFYMSHHKPKMVAALVNEANRVYRLWCRNNPGFARNGRVHIIAHSLGSVMTLEVLSRQPTSVAMLDLEKPAEVNHFEFDTKNLFFIGSPSAFFLLLERGALMPRRNRRKPGVDPADVQSDEIVGEAGAFGCIAVDNIYNVLAREDAVAYLLNGTVDPVYAASLKTAYVPSATTGFFQSVGNAMWSMVPGMSSASKGTTTNPAADEDQRPPPLRLPSQLELEVHDFTREEMAEQKAYLLNDNGQIDYFLRSSGGPLEIQYLNMLSAHSSYWYNTDLIRMLCMEIGRKPGRKHTLPAMRAVKNAKRVL
ncbi:DDHD domain-containing protein [Microdochium trichocladiopsis]|uniref:DDHD domain-containing protein n=1 Tax=Microdochium trichocladiopsis TaxID=1682393 RepID=A0A9P8XVV0_9PEZI|nr:DDHD domain-containing protein [Microdochium trichocladiopsis]KAH7021094.1 DDHD domain-containing protein [Microdochium trichocladiopsis]